MSLTQKEAIYMSGTISIDLHGLLVEDAEFRLRGFVDMAPAGTHTVEVVHGIGTGALKNMVHDFYHSRIEAHAQCIGNPGQTNLYLRQ